MMTLIEQSPVPAAVLPVAEFKDHLRLGTGFADDAAQDGLAESYLRAALAAIEGRIGKALISRGFLWGVSYWRDPAEQALPLAPGSAIASLVLIDAAGTETTADPAGYRLVKDGQCACAGGADGFLGLAGSAGDRIARMRVGVAGGQLVRRRSAL